MSFGRKKLLRREESLKKFIYKGEGPFIAGHFRLSPGQVIDGLHPAVGFGVAGLEPLDGPAPEPAPEPEPETEEESTEEDSEDEE